MGLQDTAAGLGGDTVDKALAFEWLGQFATIPLGEGTPELIRSLAGHLDQIHCHRGGKRRAGDHGQAWRIALQGAACERA
jgi:hypothetical protein